MYKVAPVPFPQTREALRASLATVKDLPAEVADRLTTQARPAILLAAVATDAASLPLGDSRFGGAPDLPRGMPWPGRLAYPDAEKRIAFYRLQIGPILAKAGIAPNWLSAADGQAYIARQREIDRSAIEGALKFMPADEAGAMRDMLESQMSLTPDDARAQAAQLQQKADAVARPMPLPFLAQIDLAALASQPGFSPDFPREGRLLLFYDLLENPTGHEPGSATGFRLVWDNTPRDQLVRAAIPEQLSGSMDETVMLGTASIVPQSIMTPITPFERAWDAIAMPDPNKDTYGQGPFWAYQQWLSTFGDPATDGRPNLQLGGWAQPLQNGMQARAQLASHGFDAEESDSYDKPEAKQALQGASDWQLVLQIGVDARLGLTAGAYYVLMRRDDIRERRFDKAWIIFQT